MTTLQESAMRLALAALTSTDALPYEDWMRASGHPAIKALNAALAQQREPVAGLNRSYTEQLINALHENSDPVSIDAAEEFQRLLAAALAQQELQQKERPDFMAGYDAGMADAKRMAQQGEQQVWKPTGAAIAALKRFEETCSDGEGYDVPKDTMHNLQAIGLVYRTRGSVYCITYFGHHVLAAAPAPHPAQPLLAHEVLKLNALWNKSSVKDSAIADQLAVCRALAESEDDMELTEAQILTLWEETYVQRGWTGIEFARAIERAHGIGVKP